MQFECEAGHPEDVAGQDEDPGRRTLAGDSTREAGHPEDSAGPGEGTTKIQLAPMLLHGERWKEQIPAEYSSGMALCWRHVGLGVSY